MRFVVMLAVLGCSADPKQREPPASPATPTPGPVRFYCSKRLLERDATCILATRGGDDRYAQRYKDHCEHGSPCEEREGAWCYAAAPATHAVHPFNGDKMACFVDEASCAPPPGMADKIACAPMSAAIAIIELELEDRDPARADPVTIDYHCSDVTTISGEDCFDSLWSCAFRRYQMISVNSPCRRVDRVWCYEAAMPKLGLGPVESCKPSPEQCEVARRGRDNSNPTACAMKPNPTH